MINHTEALNYKFRALEVSIIKAMHNLSAYTKDGSVSLEERWKTFLAAPDFLKEDLEIIELPTTLTIAGGPGKTLYDLGLERYQSMLVEDFVDDIIANEEGITEDELIAIRKYFMKQNAYKITYDW